jgi:cytidine deaminase
MDNAELIRKAKEVLRKRAMTEECTAGEVSAAVLTSDGNVYVGVSISAACGIGFCAEHSAVAHMVTMGESRVAKVVALSADGKFLPPCGRCRELLFQVDRENAAAEVLLGEERTVRLEELLPMRWQDSW